MTLGYELIRFDPNYNNQYGELQINIIWTDDYGKGHRLVTFTWGIHKTVDHWYGFALKLNLDQYNMNNSLNAANKFLRKFEQIVNDGNSPESIVNWLNGLRGMHRMVYDARDNNFVRLDELPDPSWNSWGDNINWTSVIAQDEYHAKQLLTQKILSHSTARYDQWVRAGKEVKQDTSQYNRFSADIRPVAEILKYPF